MRGHCREETQNGSAAGSLVARTQEASRIVAAATPGLGSSLTDTKISRVDPGGQVQGAALAQLVRDIRLQLRVLVRRQSVGEEEGSCRNPLFIG